MENPSQPTTPCINCGADNWEEKRESLGLDEQEPIEGGKPDKHGIIPTERTGRTALHRVWYCKKCNFTMFFGIDDETDRRDPYDV